MERFIAFLRGVNVSGQKILKMETLRETMSKLGFADVKTYIQSGNVLFNSDIQDYSQLILSIEKLIEETFGFHTDVIVRKVSEIELITNSTVFATLKSDDDKKYYITFLKHESTDSLEFPLISKNEDVEIISHDNRDFISISTLYKGNYGFPNSFIEKLTGIPATTRNPNTLEKILKT